MDSRLETSGQEDTRKEIQQWVQDANAFAGKLFEQLPEDKKKVLLSALCLPYNTIKDGQILSNAPTGASGLIEAEPFFRLLGQHGLDRNQLETSVVQSSLQVARWRAFTDKVCSITADETLKAEKTSLEARYTALPLTVLLKENAKKAVESTSTNQVKILREQIDLVKIILDSAKTLGKAEFDKTSQNIQDAWKNGALSQENQSPQGSSASSSVAQKPETTWSSLRKKFNFREGEHTNDEFTNRIGRSPGDFGR